jgi:hypothetical protein
MNRQIGLWVFVCLFFLMATAPVRAGDVPEALTTFEAATKVIGQKDFSTAGCSVPSARTMCDPYGETFAHNLLYIADADYNRVLGFKKLPKKNGGKAKFVLGQSNFSGTNSATTKSALNFPTAVVAAGTQLFVNDFSNSRVLIWNKLPTKSNTPASVVVGQADFTSNGPTTAKSGLSFPEAGLAVAGGKLLVADRNNSRIMIWNTIPTTNGANADVVVGQPDFTSSDNHTSQTGLNEPEGIWSDGTKLVVADFMNNRVLIWNTIPTTNDAPADVVVGQADFNTGDLPNPPTAQSLNRPFDVVSDGARLFVADTFNNRVLVYSPFPTSNNPTASFVLGQGDFTHGDSNAGNLNPSAQTLSNPYGMFISGSQLFVSDFNNARVLIFGI